MFESSKIATVLLMKNNLEDAIKYYDISLEKGKPNSSCIRNKGNN